MRIQFSELHCDCLDGYTASLLKMHWFSPLSLVMHVCDTICDHFFTQGKKKKKEKDLFVGHLKVASGLLLFFFFYTFYHVAISYGLIIWLHFWEIVIAHNKFWYPTEEYNHHLLGRNFSKCLLVVICQKKLMITFCVQIPIFDKTLSNLLFLVFQNFNIHLQITIVNWVIKCISKGTFACPWICVKSFSEGPFIMLYLLNPLWLLDFE